MFPDCLDLLHAISDPSPVDMTCMLKGMISHDCNVAQAQGNMFQSLIIELAKVRGIILDEQLLLQGSCHNHLHNAWMDSVELFPQVYI